MEETAFTMHCKLNIYYMKFVEGTQWKEVWSVGCVLDMRNVCVIFQVNVGPRTLDINYFYD